MGANNNKAMTPNPHATSPIHARITSKEMGGGRVGEGGDGSDHGPTPKDPTPQHPHPNFPPAALRGCGGQGAAASPPTPRSTLAVASRHAASAAMHSS